MSDEDLNTSADYFADSSAETVKESGNKKKVRGHAVEEVSFTDYPDQPPSPVIDEQMEKSILSGDMSGIVSEIVKDNAVPARICCPFCLIDFGFEDLLKDHIKESHARELKYVHRARPGELDFYECPFCPAKFFSSALLPKHIIRKHELCVLNMFSGFSPEKYVYCRFCPHKIIRKHYKLLMIHIEKKHFQLFEKYVLMKYCNFSKSLEDLVGVGEVVYDTPSHSSKKDEIDRVEGPTSPRPILKPRTAYPVDESEWKMNEKSDVNYANLNINEAHSSQRKLRFDLPDSPDKENKAKKRKIHMPNLKNFVSKKAKLCGESSSSSNSSPQRPLHQFKCGLCKESFDLNEQLIDHLKAKHRGLTFRAQYKCGLCSAKFYRNSYLVRHCWHHHAPLCLKTPTGGNRKSKVSQF